MLAARPRTQGDAADATHKVREGGVLHQVLQQLAMRSADELHAALGNGAARKCLRLRANLVNYYHLRPGKGVRKQNFALPLLRTNRAAENTAAATFSLKPLTCDSPQLQSSPDAAGQGGGPAAGVRYQNWVKAKEGA